MPKSTDNIILPYLNLTRTFDAEGDSNFHLSDSDAEFIWTNQDSLKAFELFVD
jgi:hypothetical protein